MSSWFLVTTRCGARRRSPMRSATGWRKCCEVRALSRSGGVRLARVAVHRGSRAGAQSWGTLLVDVRAGRYPEYILACGLDDDGAIAWVGIRVPPFYLLTSDLQPSLASELVEWWLQFDPELHGIDGPPEAARAIADAWAAGMG